MMSPLKLLSAGLLASTMLSTPGLALAQSPGSPGSSGSASPPVSSASAAQAESDAVEEIVVRGRFIPDVKRETSEIANVITTEDLTRTGDSDIAAALTRVTGLSLVGDGYVYVRGLGERYSSALLDGSTLPSPEPLRRVVSLDIFPTSILASTLVQKTYSVEYPAEFGGGIVSLTTRAVPQEPYLEFSISGGYNSESTLKRGNFADYGEGDWTGFRDPELRFPEVLQDNPRLQGVSPTDRQVASRLLRNSWSFDRETVSPDAGLRVSGGTAFDLGEMRAGLLGTIDYSSQFRLRDGIRRTFAASFAGLEPNEDLTPEACEQINPNVNPDGCGVFRTNWDVRLNILGAAGLEISPDHQLKLTTLVLRRTTQEARIERGSLAESPGNVLSRQRSNFIEQQVWTNQLSGEHHFLIGGPLNELELNWRASYSKANRDTPYRREYTYAADSQGRFRWDLAQGRNATIFSALEDDNIEFGADGRLSGTMFGRDTNIRFGGVTTQKDREFVQRRYQFDLLRNVGCGTVPDATLYSVPEIILSPDNIGSVCGFAIFDATQNSDTFKAQNDIHALYASLEHNLLETLRWTLGVRGEKSEQSVDTFRQAPAGSPLEPINVELNQEYLLPASTLTWEFADGFQARVGYSQTLARPDLRELAPSQFFDVDTGTTEVGNPNLRITRIQNFDGRVEWYFGNRRSATLGVFYKDLKNPIERTFYFTGEGPTRSLANADSAKLRGVEAEFDVALPLQNWLDGGFFADREFYVIGNATYIDSEVERSLAEFPNITKQGGALQGQSRYLGNLQFGYDSPALQEKFAILLNYQSKRIFGVGINGIPNSVEIPPLSLDVTASKGFSVLGRDLEFGVKVNNILNGKFKTRQGDQIAETYKLGQSVSLSLTATF